MLQKAEAVALSDRWSRGAPVALQPVLRGMTTVRLSSIIWAGWSTILFVAHVGDFPPLAVAFVTTMFLLEFILHLSCAFSDPGSCPREEIADNGDVLRALPPDGRRVLVRRAVPHPDESIQARAHAIVKVSVPDEFGVNRMIAASSFMFQTRS